MKEPRLQRKQPTWTEPAPLFWKPFGVKPDVALPLPHVSSPGFNEVRLNGAKVGGHLLEPAFTRWSHSRLNWPRRVWAAQD